MREKTITVRTSKHQEILIITDQLQRALADLTSGDGICTIIVPHTTCAISVNENADPDVPSDILKALRSMIPKVDFDHAEGNSDAHLLTTIIGTSLAWPYRKGQLVFGTWQGVYFIELDGPRTRKVTIYVNE